MVLFRCLTEEVEHLRLHHLLLRCHPGSRGLQVHQVEVVVEEEEISIEVVEATKEVVVIVTREVVVTVIREAVPTIASVIIVTTVLIKQAHTVVETTQTRALIVPAVTAVVEEGDIVEITETTTEVMTVAEAPVVAETTIPQGEIVEVATVFRILSKQKELKLMIIFKPIKQHMQISMFKRVNTISNTIQEAIRVEAGMIEDLEVVADRTTKEADIDNYSTIELKFGINAMNLTDHLHKFNAALILV